MSLLRGKSSEFDLFLCVLRSNQASVYSEVKVIDLTPDITDFCLFNRSWKCKYAPEGNPSKESPLKRLARGQKWHRHVLVLLGAAVTSSKLCSAAQTEGLQQPGAVFWEIHKTCWAQLCSQFGPQLQLLKPFHNICKGDSENRTSVLPGRGGPAVYTGAAGT